jgi:hypothetical protein
MTDVLEERLRAAADQAMTGVELETPASDDAVAPPRRQSRWLTVAAGTAAAVVLGVVVWAAALRDPGPTEPVQPSPDAPAQVRARAAVEATLAAPRWRAEVSGGVTPMELWFHEPDRAESIAGIEPVDRAGDPPMRTVQIGDDLYTSNDGGWTRTTAPPRGLDNSHRSLLEGLLADGPCFANQGDLIVAWQDPETGCGSSTTALPDDLPPGSDLWVLRIDADGRVDDFVVGEVPGAVGSEREDLVLWPPSPSDGIDRPMRSAGGQPAYIYSFTYADVPPITAPDRYTTATSASSGPPATTDTGDTVPDDCVIRVVTVPGAKMDDVRPLVERPGELTFDQKLPAADVAEALRSFPFVVSVTEPGSECADQAVPLAIDPAG